MAKRLVWFRLVDQEGLAYRGATASSVSIPSNYVIDQFRDAVHKKCSGILHGTISMQLLVYADKTALDANAADTPTYLRSSRSLIEGEKGANGDFGLGPDEDHALLVVVPLSGEPPSKRQKTMWTTTTLDLAASTLPNVDDCKPVTWSLEATTISGFGLHSPRNKLVIFCRNEVVKLLHFLQNDVVRDGRCGYVIGPSGSGKSATAVSFALSLAETKWVVTWIHLRRRLSPVCVRLETNTKKEIELGPHYTEDRELDMILADVDDTKKHIVFLDGLTLNNRVEEVTRRGWLEKNRANRRLVLVTSMLTRGKTNLEEDIMMRVHEHFVPSWTLKDYLTAVENDELFRVVQSKLDASDDYETAESMEAIDDRETAAFAAATDCTISFRQSLVRSKHYFTGGSARYMFCFSTAQVVASLKAAVDALSIFSMVTDGIVVDNQLFCRFERFERPRIISRYAASSIAMFTRPELIKKLESALEAHADAATDDWILEMFFFACIRKGGVTLYDDDDDEEITWPQGIFLVVDPQNLPKLPPTSWLKPHKYNQGGYDAIYIDQARGLVRFVQVTSAHNHLFHIRYFYHFLCYLRDAVWSFEVKTLEIFFVIETKAVSNFKFSEVTGEGLLEAFPGWEKYKEINKVKRVGIQGVTRWREFDW